jgi:hypothetical protein
MQNMQDTTDQSPLENMKELHEWLTIWGKHVETEKRGRTDNSTEMTTTTQKPRKRVSIPKKLQ